MREKGEGEREGKEFELEFLDPTHTFDGFKITYRTYLRMYTYRT